MSVCDTPELCLAGSSGRVAPRACLCARERACAGAAESLHTYIYTQGAPLRLPKPLSDQFPLRVCSCPLCIINRL